MDEMIHVLDHPLLQHKLSILRDETTGVKDFREIVNEVATLMCYEATRDLPLQDVEVQTPVAKAVGALLYHPETRFYVKQNPGTNAHSPDAYAFDAEGWPIPAHRAPLTYAVEALSRLLVALERLGITNFTRRLLNCPTPT